MIRWMLVMMIGGGVALGADAPSGPQVSELTNQGWQEVAKATETPAADPVLIRTDDLLQHGQYHSALNMMARWLKDHPLGTPHRDAAIYMMAEALYQQGDRLRSFYYLDELMDEYPSSPLFYKALEKQYQIADAYLRGYKRRFLLMPILSAEDEAVEMLYRIQQRSPGSPLAEKSLLRTADYYYASGDYDLAADTYAAYTRAYPRSPEVPRALLRQAFSNFAQFRGLRFDATPLVDARTQLVEIMGRYPKLSERENLPALIQRIDRTFAQKVLATGDFYRWTGQPEAAAWNYSFLMQTYPNSPEAAAAQKRLDGLPESVQKGPRPDPGAGYVPTTQPGSISR